MKCLFTISLVILLSSFAALAQNQSVTADKTDEYYKILVAAYDKFLTSPYRVKVEQIIKDKVDFWIYTITTIHEYLPPDKERRIRTEVHTYSKNARIVDTIGFPRDSRTETIIIGNLEFVKEDNKNWKKTEKTATKEAREENPEHNLRITFLGRQNIDRKQFDIYEVNKIKEPSQPKVRYWINVTSGLLEKMDHDIVETEDTTNKTTITFELDASIKIEAPKLN